MSASVSRADTMMMGVGAMARMRRHTSMPDIPGRSRSSNTRSGGCSAKRRNASMPSDAISTSYPSRVSPAMRASR